MTALRYLFLFFALTILGSDPALADKRIVLIIGNSNYKNVARLSNPANDANLVGDMFRNAGFDLVDTRFDLGVAETRKSLREFGAKARDADVAVIYYAGHGIELDGTNYLVPIDAALETDADVLDEAIALDRVLFAVEPARQLRLVILDACRDNPFAKSMKRSVASRGIGRGLAKVEPNSPNTMIAFSAKAGSTAADGDSKNSPFAIAVVTHLPKPGLDLRRALGFVRDDVLKATGNRQEPYVYGSLGGNDAPLVPAPPAAANASDSDAVMRRDYEFAERIGSRSALDAFIAKYPSGFYTVLARSRLEKLPREEANAAARVPPTRSTPTEPAAPDQQAPLPAPGPGKPPAVAALTTPNEPSAAAAPAVADLPRLLRSELRRVGCTVAESDRDWDADSQRALARFNASAGTHFDTKLASVDALDVVKAKTGRVCPLECRPGYRGDGGSCVKISCRANETLNDDGECVAKRDRERKEGPDTRTKTPAVASRPESAETAHSHGKGCSNVSQRCALQIGGRCDPATGHWEYGRNGAGGDTLSFNNCLSRMLAGSR